MIGLDPRVSGAQRYAVDAERPGMLHAAFVRSPHPHARVRAIAVPDGCVALGPDDVADLGRYGCQVKDEQVLAPSPATPATSWRPSPRRRARRPSAAAAAVEVEWEPLPAVFDAVEAVSDSAPLLHEQAGAPAHEAVSIDVRPIPGSNVCHRFLIRRGDAARALAERRRGRRGGLPHAERGAHADGAARRAGGVGRRPVDAVDGHADAVQRARRPGRRVRPPGGRIRDRRAADGRLVRGQDVRAPGGAGRRARAQGGRAGQGRARPHGGVRHAQPPSGDDPRAPRRAAATARWSPRSSTAGSTPAPTPTAVPGVATKLGYAGVGPYRIPHVRVDSLADLHQPAAQRGLPRLRRDAVGVGVRAGDGPARRRSSA